MGTPEDEGSLEQALADLWTSEPHQIAVGAHWLAAVQLVWVAGHVNRFEDGELIARAPAATPRTAVALARSWLAQDVERDTWVPVFDRVKAPELSTYDLPVSPEVRELTRPLVVKGKRRDKSPLNIWFGPSVEAQSSLGTGFRVDSRETVGWEGELVGWLQPALIDRVKRKLPRGSWVVLEARGAVLMDLLAGEPELRVGPSVVGTDFGQAVEHGQLTTTSGLWAGALVRARAPLGAVRVGGDALYRVPVRAGGTATDAALIGRLSRFAGVAGMVGVPIKESSLELAVGGLWRLDPDAAHGTPQGWPLQTRVSWVVKP